MQNLYRIVMLLIVASFLIYCGGENSGDPTPSTDQKIEVRLDSGGGIYALFYNGVNLLSSTNDYKGAYYIIGSCPQDGVGIDDENNVNSQSSQSGQLLNIGDKIQTLGRLKSGTDFCDGTDYEFIFSRPEENKILVSITIAQLPEEYFSLSLPMDFKKYLFNRFRFGETDSYTKTYEGGSCWDYMTVDGDSGYYADSFESCSIPAGDRIGVAKTESSPWIESCSDELGICVKRTIIEISQHKGTFAYNHFGTNNIEFGFGNFMPEGTSFYFKEEILIYEF